MKTRLLNRLAAVVVATSLWAIPLVSQPATAAAASRRRAAAGNLVAFIYPV